MPPSDKSSKLIGLWNSLAQIETAVVNQPAKERENQVKLDDSSKHSSRTPTETVANQPTKQKENQVKLDSSSKHFSPTPSQTEDDRLEASNEEIITETKSMAKSTKRRWKPEEILRVVELRGELNDKFQSVKGRMVLWEQISSVMLSHGMDRSAAQCKSLWASLVQKYEVYFFFFFKILFEALILSIFGYS